MKVHEATKKLKVSNKEFIQQYADHGITSHLSKIPHELEAELFGDEKKINAEGQGSQTADSAETVVVGEVVQKTEGVSKTADAGTEECPYTTKQIKRSIQIFGSKSPCWKWRHLMDG